MTTHKKRLQKRSCSPPLSVSMKLAASVSESFQASVGYVQTSRTASHKPQQEEEKAVGTCAQVLLVMAVCGVEIVVVFEQIYQVLIMQYLGVPLPLVSINGLICGVTSLVIIPVVGYVTDRGTNPKRRKMVSMLVGMSLYQTGILLLFTSGVIKISVLDNLLHELESNQSLLPATGVEGSQGNSPSNDISVVNYSAGSLDQTNSSSSDRDKGIIAETGFPVTGYLVFVGFALVDIAFDVSLSTTRAYILESVPNFQHRKILVTTTAVQAASGTAFAFLGVFDISDALGHAFGVDGTAAILLFFCILLFVSVTFCFLSSAITGYFLTKNRRSTHDEVNSTKSSSGSMKTGTCSGNMNYADSADISAKPLLDNKHVDNYASVNAGSSFTRSDYRFRQAEKCIFERSKADPPYPDSGPVENASSLSISGSSVSKYVRETKAESSYERTYVSSKIHESEKSSSTKSTFTNSNTAQPSEEGHSSQVGEIGRKHNMKKKLAILVTSTFFTLGASTSFLFYSANALTLGIFHGDPTALPGTEGKDLYEKGLRTAALGNLSFYILFTITSLLNRKIIDLVGERVLFVLFQLIFLVPLLALVLTRCIEAYFVTVLTMGVFRHTIYTLPFVMATEITQDKGTNGSANLGKIMSLIGFLIPAHIIIFQAVIGPAIQATGSVWVPLMYALISGCASVAVFLLMFIVK